LAGRPKGTTGKPKKIIKDYSCQNCGDLKRETEYYVSYNPIHKMGRILYCKKCIKNMISDDKGNIILDKVKNTLQLMDRPFLYNIWRSSLEEGGEVMGCYMKNIAMTQYRKLGWKDSKMLPEIEHELNYDSVNNEKCEVEITHNFNVTSEMILRWGNKYNSLDYMQLEQFYNQMKIDNKIESAQDETYLKKLAVISLKLDKALEDEDYDKANKLGNLFSKYMGDSQFRAMDKSDASKSGGLRTFAQTYAEIEKDDFIPPWEYYRNIKELEQDIVDKTIMYILNYTLKLNKVSQMIEPPIDTPKLKDMG
jgi:hypothetical protein